MDDVLYRVEGRNGVGESGSVSDPDVSASPARISAREVPVEGRGNGEGETGDDVDREIGSSESKFRSGCVSQKGPVSLASF
jgi:hypothetical protein